MLVTFSFTYAAFCILCNRRKGGVATPPTPPLRPPVYPESPQLTKWRLTEALYGILKLWIADNVLVVMKQDINERGLQNIKLNRNYTNMSELLYICHQILGEGV